MKKLNIPSVVEFRLKDKVTDMLAKDLFSIERNKGSRFESLNKIKNLENSNAYLNQQFDRLRKYAQEGQIEKFDFLANILLKNSKVFLLYGLNHSNETHPGARTTKVLKLLKKVINLAIHENSNISCKRLWIDKKVDDYGRPLTVPEMADRIYGHMYTRIMEAYLCGTNQYSVSQHGGTPGRGVQSYLIELADKFPSSRHIFEFDIRGYFDHIKHSAILELFRSKVILRYLEGALKSSPISYTLPPKEKDMAYNKYIENDLFEFFEVQFREDNMVDITPKNELYGQFQLTLSFPPETRPVIINHEILRKLQPRLILEDWRITYTPMGELGTRIRLIHLETNWETDLYTQEKILDIQRVTLEKVYKLAQERGLIVDDTNINPFSIEREKATEEARAVGRDNWKDLLIEGHGVPQGSSFGPVLSSILLGKVMPKESLLYMDDGIIFLGNKRTSEKTMVKRVNKMLAPIGCELNESKSNLLTSSTLIRKGFKILGTNIKRSIFNVSKMEIESNTRKGISRPFFPKDTTSITALVLEMYRNKYITLSKQKVLNWYIKEGKLEFLDNSTLIKLADKIGILGAIINRAYSPTTTVEDMKEQIEYGIFKAEMKIKSSRGSLGERLLSHTKVIAVEGTEERVNVKPNLYIVRSIANDILLRYLKGELPARSLRVQGMRKKFVCPKLSKTIRRNTDTQIK